MAGGWIKIEHSTPDKPEVMRIARTLGVTENEVLGGLVRFWLWCDYQSRDGHALGVTQTGLDRISGVTGMYGAMLDAGWLVEDEGGVHAPNYEYHLSENSKARALATKRKARQRSEDVTPMSRCERDKNATREEERREDNIEIQHTHSRAVGDEWKSQIQVPFGWSHDDTLKALDQWVGFRLVEDGRAPSVIQLTAILQNKGSAGWSCEKFCRSIPFTIERAKPGQSGMLLDPDIDFAAIAAKRINGTNGPKQRFKERAPNEEFF